MKNRHVAHLWAHEAKPSAKGNHFYFDGDTIYSYGSHFPIARTLGDCVLFTTRRYSVTTERHKSYALQACSHMPVFFVERPTEKPSQTDVDAYRTRIDAAALSAARARVHKQWAIDRLTGLVAEGNRFCDRFGFATQFSLPTNFQELRAQAKQAEQKERERQARRQAQIEKETAETVNQWLAGASVTIPYRASKTYIRAKDGNLETSHGAVVPLADAHKAFRFAKLHKVNGWRRNGEQFQVGDYQLDAVNEYGIIAGCHRISWEEIERFAQTQNW